MQYLNFPLILVIAVFVTGLIWCLDLLLFKRGRLVKVEQAKARWPGWDDEGSRDQNQYTAELNETARVPLMVEYARSLFPVLAIVLILRSFIVEPFQIPSGSMIPTLKVGDFILVNKFTYGIRLPVTRTKVFDIGEPQRGDVMVFFPPHIQQYYIKRVIGVPGDIIEYKDKVLTINGEVQTQRVSAEGLGMGQAAVQLEETINGVTHEIRQQGALFEMDNFSIKVREGHYFMMGDNRDNSLDSRVWGQVSEENIVGKAFAIWMHWEKFFSLPSFSRAGSIH